MHLTRKYVVFYARPTRLDGNAIQLLVESSECGKMKLWYHKSGVFRCSLGCLDITPLFEGS